MANPAAERILGATSAQMQGRTNVDVAWHCVRADGTDLPGEELPASVALRTGLELRGETVGVFTPDGRLSWLSVTAVPMFDGTPREVIGVVVSFTDVTADRAAADALRASEQQFRLAFDNAPIGMLVVSLRPGEVGRTLQVNEAFCRMLGYNAATEAESVLELSQPDWTHEDDRERDALLLRRLAEGDTDRVSFEKRYVNRHGQTVHAWVEGAVAYGPDSEPWYVIVHCLDVTDRKQAQDELRRLALTDSLTGLANRTLLDDRIRLALTRLRRNQGYVALLLIDLDRFKVVNDSLGHELGDSLLVEAARRLLAVTRAGTTVARLGGDEFVVFLDGLATADEAQVVARRLLATLREPYALPGSDEPMVTTASLGIAVTADPRRNAADLLREADLALYRAKDAGRDRSALFDDELKTRVVARLDAEHRLRRAIDGGHLVALHQPVIQLSDGAITGVETLVRIQDPDVGLLPPVAFIDVAEDTGLIVEVDAWIVEHAVGQFAQWQAAGLPTQHIAVNVSPRSLEEARFADVLGCALSRHGVEGMRVHVELTERSLLNSTAAAQRTLDALREMGVRVGIDDFGTGYSALAYLQRFALDFMKIDRSFVARLGTSVRDDAVVAAIIDLAHAHELEVIAEGVEEPGQLARLRSMGCDAAQGYLMGRPMRPEDVEALCRAGHTW
jgi:diguanylate cyclase (GGDEF)-like protein/PAS domain S-box-containing protein